MSVSPARMLYCSNKCRAPICEQLIPVEVICATTGLELRTQATSTRIGSARYQRALLLVFIVVPLSFADSQGAQ